MHHRTALLVSLSILSVIKAHFIFMYRQDFSKPFHCLLMYKQLVELHESYENRAEFTEILQAHFRQQKRTYLL